MAAEIHYRNGTIILAETRVVQEGNSVTPWRQARVRDPTGRFIKDPTNRILQPKTSIYTPDHSEVLSIGRPIGMVNILENLTRSASSQRHPC